MTSNLPAICRAALLTLAATLIASCGSETPESIVNSAKVHLEKGESREAIIKMKNALEQKPDLAEARHLLGKALYEAGDARSAALELQKALDLRYSADASAPLLMRALIASGQVDKAIAMANTVPVLDPEAKADLADALSLAYSIKGDKDGAFAANAKSLAAKADYVPALITQARLLAGTGDLPKALTIVEFVLQKLPNSGEAWKLKGDILAEQGAHGLDVEAYRKALLLQPKPIATHSSLIGALMRDGKLAEAEKALGDLRAIAPKNPQTNYRAAQLAMLKGDFLKARDLSQQLLSVVPDNPAVLFQAGYIAFELQAWSQAENYLLKSVSLAPQGTGAIKQLGLTYVVQGKSAKAVELLSRAMPLIENDPAALGLAGEAYIQNGDWKRGQELYAQAVRLDPTEPRKRTALALARFATGQTESALNEMDKIAASSKDTSADLALISSRMQRGSYELALQDLDRLEKKLPNNAAVHNLRAQVLRLGKQDNAAARKSYEQALAIDPAFLPAAKGLADLDMAANKPAEAEGRFEAILKTAPKSASAVLALAEIKIRRGAPKEDVVALLNRGVALDPADVQIRASMIGYLLRVADGKKAVAVAQDAATALPNSPALFDLLGQAQLAAGDLNQALSAYSKMASLNPESIEPLIRKAQAYVSIKDWNAARESLNKALAMRPGSIEVQRTLVDLELRAGKSADALSIAKRIQGQRSTDATGYILTGDIHAVRKEWADAEESYRASLKIESDQLVAIKLHSVLTMANKIEAATAFSADWLKRNPKSVEFMGYLAEAAFTRGDLQTYENQFRSIVEIMPSSAMALNNLAWAAGRLKRADALSLAEKANKISPNEPAFMDTWAQLLSEKGETPQAIALLTKAVELAPETPAFRLNLARVLIKAGRKSDAKKQLDELAKLGDKFPEKAALAELQKSL